MKFYLAITKNKPRRQFLVPAATFNYNSINPAVNALLLLVSVFPNFCGTVCEGLCSFGYPVIGVKLIGKA